MALIALEGQFEIGDVFTRVPNNSGYLEGVAGPYTFFYFDPSLFATDDIQLIHACFTTPVTGLDPLDITISNLNGWTLIDHTDVVPGNGYNSVSFTFACWNQDVVGAIDALIDASWAACIITYIIRGNKKDVSGSVDSFILNVYDTDHYDSVKNPYYADSYHKVPVSPKIEDYVTEEVTLGLDGDLFFHAVSWISASSFRPEYTFPLATAGIDLLLYSSIDQFQMNCTIGYRIPTTTDSDGPVGFSGEIISDVVDLSYYPVGYFVGSDFYTPVVPIQLHHKVIVIKHDLARPAITGHGGQNHFRWIGKWCDSGWPYFTDVHPRPDGGIVLGQQYGDSYDYDGITVNANDALGFSVPFDPNETYYSYRAFINRDGTTAYPENTVVAPQSEISHSSPIPGSEDILVCMTPYEDGIILYGIPVANGQTLVARISPQTGVIWTLLLANDPRYAAVQVVCNTQRALLKFWSYNAENISPELPPSSYNHDDVVSLIDLNAGVLLDELHHQASYLLYVAIDDNNRPYLWVNRDVNTVWGYGSYAHWDIRGITVDLSVGEVAVFPCGVDSLTPLGAYKLPNTGWEFLSGLDPKCVAGYGSKCYIAMEYFVPYPTDSETITLDYTITVYSRYVDAYPGYSTWLVVEFDLATNLFTWLWVQPQELRAVISMNWDLMMTRCGPYLVLEAHTEVMSKLTLETLNGPRPLRQSQYSRNGTEQTHASADLLLVIDPVRKQLVGVTDVLMCDTPNKPRISAWWDGTKALVALGYQDGVGNISYGPGKSTETGRTGGFGGIVVDIIEVASKKWMGGAIGASLKENFVLPSTPVPPGPPVAATFTGGYSWTDWVNQPLRLNYPTGWQEGDLLVIWIITWEHIDYSVPSGWEVVMPQQLIPRYPGYDINYYNGGEMMLLTKVAKVGDTPYVDLTVTAPYDNYLISMNPSDYPVEYTVPSGVINVGIEVTGGTNGDFAWMEGVSVTPGETLRGYTSDSGDYAELRRSPYGESDILFHIAGASDRGNSHIYVENTFNVIDSIGGPYNFRRILIMSDATDEDQYDAIMLLIHPDEGTMALSTSSDLQPITPQLASQGTTWPGRMGVHPGGLLYLVMCWSNMTGVPDIPGFETAELLNDYISYNDTGAFVIDIPEETNTPEWTFPNPGANSFWAWTLQLRKATG